MIDLDDVGDGFWIGGLVIGLLFLVIYLVFSVPQIKECEKPTPDHPNGGVVLKKSNGDHVCIDKNALNGAKTL